jgi:hypothetical protein
MKKSLLLFSLSVALSAKAQTSVYHPFPDSDAYWCQTDKWFDGTCDGNENYTIFFNGDTTIGSHVYHKLAKSGYGYSTICGPNGDGYYYYNYIAAIRQDTSQKKVWIYNDGTHMDTVLYDFNLQIGDTLDQSKVYWAAYGGGQGHVIVSIDSILISGHYRKKYNYTACQFSFSDSSIIEGIGSTSGLMSPPSCGEYSYYLNNSGQNVKVFPDSTVFGCYINTSTNNLPEKNISITLSPNPFHTTATLEIKNEELKMKNLEFKIYDVMGRVVREQIVNSKSEIVNRNDLPDGLYFYQLRIPNESGQANDYELIASGKFVVE